MQLSLVSLMLQPTFSAPIAMQTSAKKTAPGLSQISGKPQPRLDILHILDLGVAAYAHGSLLFSIMEKLPGASRFLPAIAASFFFGWIAPI